MSQRGPHASAVQSLFISWHLGVFVISFLQSPAPLRLCTLHTKPVLPRIRWKGQQKIPPPNPTQEITLFSRGPRGASRRRARRNRDQQEDQAPDRATLRRLLSLAKPYWRHFTLAG